MDKLWARAIARSTIRCRYRSVCRVRGTTADYRRYDCSCPAGARPGQPGDTGSGFAAQCRWQGRRVAKRFVQDIESLGRVVDANPNPAPQEIPRVEALIEEEMSRLISWRRSLRAAPVITALRAQVENFQAEVAQGDSRSNDQEKQAVEAATRAVTNKILHGPMTAIRDYATQAEQEAEALNVIKKLFVNLESSEPDKSDS